MFNEVSKCKKDSDSVDNAAFKDLQLVVTSLKSITSK